MIADRLWLDYVGAGDIARKIAQTDPEVKAELDAGRMAPRETMNKAMASVIKNGQVLDGYPRYMEQLTDLFRVAPTQPIFIVFNADQRTLESRLFQRGREDDHHDNIRTRLRLYQEETEPVLHYIANRGCRVSFINTDTITPQKAVGLAVAFVSEQLS